MRLPIQYALGYPERLKADFPRFNFIDYPSLPLSKPILMYSKTLKLAFQAMDKGGNMPCIMNAANEIAVEAFFKSKVGFVEMSEIIEQTMHKGYYIDKPNFNDYFNSDNEARVIASELIANVKKTNYNYLKTRKTLLMDILIKAGQLLLSLSILVILHEFGHYFFARLFKTQSRKVLFFFDPWFSLFKFKKGDTEYGIGWIPLGGYVKISGMIDESMDKEQMQQPPQPWEFRSKHLGNDF
jgi:hypothetical protein